MNLLNNESSPFPGLSIPQGESKIQQEEKVYPNVDNPFLAEIHGGGAGHQGTEKGGPIIEKDKHNPPCCNSKQNSIAFNNSIIDELVCPITMELPLDPVIAEDGRIYERSAIERVIQKDMSSLRSPVTNKKMSTKFYPGVQVKNIIEKLVRSGAIDKKEVRAEKWIIKIQDEKNLKECRTKADSGDFDAMYEIGRWYSFGLKGLTQDRSKGYAWIRKAADCGHIKSMAAAGNCLINGAGVSESVGEGMFLLGSAAMGGSDLAAYVVGMAYKNGIQGVPKNVAMAKKWLSKAVDGTCIFYHLQEEDLIKTRTELKKFIEN